MEFPSLVIYCSRLNQDQINQTLLDGQSDWLMHTASKMSDDVKNWITTEAEPLFFSNTSSSQRIIQGHIEYPNLVSGVLDCVANTALLTIDKVRRFLYQARLRANSPLGRSRQDLLESSQLLDSRETIEQQGRRAMAALDFVKRESNLAAKPLEFGLRQASSSSQWLD